MWSIIIGGLLIVSGLAFAAKPEWLRKKMQRKGIRTLRRYLVAIALSAGILLITAGWQLDGVLAKSLTLAGVILLFKGLYFLKARSADMLAAYLLKLPSLYLRLFSVGQIILGIALVML